MNDKECLKGCKVYTMKRLDARELYGLIFAAVMASVFLLWPPNEPSPTDLLNSRVEIGVATYKSSKGNDFVVFNGRSVSCVAGDFAGGRYCPGLMPYGRVSLENCRAVFATVRSRFLVDVEVLISMSCKGKPLPYFTEDALRARRVNYYDTQKYFVMPGAALMIVLLGVYYIRSTKGI